ncbi:hypothetical protein PQO03_11720 [Lentisphaera profundi]|uniref:Amino acid permease n=1 Tax=Lentisphaera profundi TaxID=1658616 RepID=A0ABY7VW98_9BACT|nr:hypothetical protein [Lentisphaera profundi]WDE98510.1 hypothetical protein PQO03_11720 [Lentisphaera profundi]
MILNILIIVIAVLLSSYLAFSPKLKKSSSWQAMVTPLASIMGSGFLVSAPLLGGVVGVKAVFCMAILLVIAYGVGSVMRYNITHFEPIENESGHPQQLAFVSRIILAGAYFISVTYYLQLLAAFLLKSLGISHPHMANWITTALLLSIGIIGIWRGLGMLEKMEKYAVALNLGMIGSLLFALVVYNINLASQGTWALPDISSDINGNDIRVLLGLLIVVQGFETSRYLGDQHKAEERIKTMKYAQITASIIYLLFISLATVLFHKDMGADVTAIIEMTTPVALVLPTLLVVAAIGSQFSAAVADNAGAGGLIGEITNHRVPVRYAYLLILLVTINLAWETNVNLIIVYASKAFALFYLLQSCLACSLAKRNKEPKRMILFAGLAIVCAFVFFIGAPAE